jgi:hypothetical protein
MYVFVFSRSLFGVFVFLAFASAGMAQQTIFNVPTTDVLDRGKVYIELDASFKTNTSPAVGRFSSFVPRIVVGAGHNVEYGLNMTGNVQPGSDSTTLSPTIKWRFYQNEKTGVSMIAGTNVFIPVRDRAYNVGSYSYVAVSKTINKTRLTAGGYVASKSVFASNAARGGGQFSFEQTVNKRLNINADWISGKHGAGYFTPGIAFKPHPKVTGYLAYSIGNLNASNGNHYFLFELGYNIN